MKFHSKINLIPAIFWSESQKSFKILKSFVISKKFTTDKSTRFLSSKISPNIRYCIRYTLILFFLFSSLSFSQTFLNPQDSTILQERFYLAKKKDFRDFPKSKIFFEIAKTFIGSDYAAHTLDSLQESKIGATLSGFDCYTLIENSLAMAETISKNDFTENGYFTELKSIRYRNVELCDYTSRLHYFTDWIWDLTRRGILKDITQQIGGEIYKESVYFMSQNPKYYKQLSKDSTLVSKLKKIENEISSRTYYYIPQDNIELAEKNIKSADIIGITTDIRGLDISHTGIAYKQNGRLYFLHSPNVGQKVQITEIPLSDYIKSHKHQTGIIVSRIIN